MIQLELCVEDYRSKNLAVKHKLDRVELCTALEVGGLTPSVAMVQYFSTNSSFETHCMIRLRPGNFHYSTHELSIMSRQIESMKKAGADGVVFGCLTDDKTIDISSCYQLIKKAKSLELECTFHRAFDFCEDPIKSLESIIELDFDRLLTSGQKNKAFEGIELINNLVIQANNRIQIMVGSGIDNNNAPDFQAIGVHALHFTAQKVKESPGKGMGSSVYMDEDKVKSIVECLKA